MNSNDFTSVVTEQVQRSLDMLKSKNDHYNPDEDKLVSFKKAAALRGQTPRQALSGMMLKHTVSVYDLCDATDVGSLEVWNEKLTDHINYLLLLRAIVEEESKDQLTGGNCAPESVSEGALAALREKLTGPPVIINHVDEEIRVRKIDNL